PIYVRWLMQEILPARGQREGAQAFATHFEASGGEDFTEDADRDATLVFSKPLARDAPIAHGHDRFMHHDVPARTQHPVDLCDHGGDVRDVMQDAEGGD